MAKKSETLAQREKAQRDLIELKRMQAGEIEPGPKPSEEAVLPQTVEEKAENFFYHYKGWVIGGVASAIVLVILITQLVTRVNYDAKVVIHSFDPTYSTYSSKIADYFETIYSDVNENGSVDIADIDCSYDPNDNSQYNMTKSQKLTTTIAAEKEALIFILDEQSAKTLSDNIGGGLFLPENIAPLGDDFYEFIEVDTISKPKTKVFAALREVEGTMADGKDAETHYNAAKQVIEKLKEKAGE